MRTVHRLHAGNHVRAVRERDEPIALGFVVPALTDHLRLVEAPVMLESQRQRFVRDLVAQISNEDAMVVCRPAPPPPPGPPVHIHKQHKRASEMQAQSSFDWDPSGARCSGLRSVERISDHPI
jgi:hypothetical protein